MKLPSSFEMMSKKLLIEIDSIHKIQVQQACAWKLLIFQPIAEKLHNPWTIKLKIFFQTWEMNLKYLKIKISVISGLYLSKPAILKSGWLRRESLFMMMSNHQFSVTNEIFIWSSNALAYFASCWFQQKC